MSDYDWSGEAENTTLTRFTEVFGKGTWFEATATIIGLDGEWGGFLVFESEIFSPPDPDLPALRFQYPTPRAACGALASTRAENYWKALTDIFVEVVRHFEPTSGM